MKILKVKEKYEKLEYNTLNEANCNVKDYLKSLNLPDARLKFCIRANMTRTVQMNYKFAQNKWKCQDYRTLDTQEHIIMSKLPTPKNRKEFSKRQRCCGIFLKSTSDQGQK